MNTTDYINSMVFNYLETWSFNRNEEGIEQYSINNEEGLFQPDSKLISTFKNDHPTANRIKQILQTEIEFQPKWLCAPVYRDAIVFYDHNNRGISILNICFSCTYMHAAPHNNIIADYKTYDWLKRLFLELGHNIENPEYSLIADFEKHKQKVRKK